MREAIPPLPITPSRRGAQLNSLIYMVMHSESETAGHEGSVTAFTWIIRKNKSGKIKMPVRLSWPSFETATSTLRSTECLVQHLDVFAPKKSLSCLLVACEPSFGAYS
jgi:hypothetical protein